MKAGTIESVKPPIMIRIPEGVRIVEGVAYLDEFVIGIITPLCPDGFIEVSSYDIIEPKGGNKECEK